MPTTDQDQSAALAVEEAERERARAEMRERQRQREFEVDQHVARLRDLAERGARAKNGCHNLDRKFGRENAHTRDALHAGIDRNTEATDQVQAELLGRREQLCRGEWLGAGDLGRLVTLWVTSQPEFAAELHRVADLPTPRGTVPLSALTSDEVRDRRDAARPHAQAAESAASRLDELLRVAAQVRNRIQLGDLDSTVAARQAVDEGEVVVKEAEEAYRQVRAVLGKDGRR